MPNRSEIYDPRYWRKARERGFVSSSSTTDAPRAVVREINGQLVLDDPDALGMIQAVGKHNCRFTLEANAERVQHFKRRVQELGRTAADTVIVLLNVDDRWGGELAEVLMPNTDWQAIRNRGEVPFARGLATREGIQEALELFDNDAADELRVMTEIAVVVVDHSVAKTFAA